MHYQSKISENAKLVLQKRYLAKDEKGRVMESIPQMFERVAGAVASAEFKYVKDRDIGQENFEESFRTFKKMMEDLDFLPNSPTLMNAGRPLGQLSACFVLPVGDSMEEIFDTVKNAALIHKSGGGTGFSFSRLRPCGSAVRSTGGVASGPVSFMKVFNAATEAVKQGGCFRGDTLIATSIGPVPIKDLKEGDMVYSWDPEKGLILTPCTAPWMTRKNAHVWELITDKDLHVIATPDHPILRRSAGSNSKKEYIKLKDLVPGTSLMPLTRYTKHHRGMDEVWITLQDGKDTRMPEHVWMARQLGITDPVIHHDDGDHINNVDGNLVGTTQNEHARMHMRQLLDAGEHPFQILTDEQRQRSIAALKNYHANMSEDERVRYIAALKAGVAGVNEERIAAGTHNFVNNPPMRNPEIKLQAKKSRVARAFWRLMEEGYAGKITRQTYQMLKKTLPQQLQFKLRTIDELFGSFDTALQYANDRNTKVVSVAPYGQCDVWNVEVPGTHNYIVCNADMTTGIVVSNTRRGANMGILRVDHPDILQFIDCKNNTHEINNFNISVAITDEFMTALRNGDVYALKDPHTNDIVGSLDAQEVFAKITYSAWRTGEPGVVFIDRINQKSPLTMMGLIESTNPCGEQPLLPYEACNLGSINLLNHVVPSDDGASMSFDFKKLEYTTANAVRFLDNVIDVNNYPLPEIDQMTRSTRKIGLGVMGFADTLLMLGIPYNSEEGVAFAKKVMQCIENAAWEQSRYLAKIRGPFPAIGQSDFATHEAPVRNATVTTIAPTGTISMIAGVSSGIEPIFAYAYIRNIMDGTHMIEANNILRDYLENYSGFDAGTIEVIKKRVADEGTVAHIEEIPEEIRKVFVCAHDIDPTAHVRMQDAFQQFTDNAVSKTINFPNSATLHDVQTAYRMAYYETSCKGLTVYRDGSRESQVLNIKAVNDEKKAAETETTTIDLGITPMKDAVTTASIQPRDRGEELDGFTRKVPIGCGKLYITINHDDKGICEVFTNNGKGGGCPSQSEATARLASIALRAGISVDAVIEQLKGIRCPSCQRNGNVKVLSCPDAIGRLLEEAVKRIEMEGCQMEQGKNPAPILPKEATESFQGSVDDNALNDADVKFAKKCPECGASLEHEGGCVICRSCGFSKCG